MKIILQIAAGIAISLGAVSETVQAESACITRAGVVKVFRQEKCPPKTKPFILNSGGSKGEKGDTGTTGPQGEKGDKGDTGDVGLQGENGAQGEPGSQGEAGPQGEAGLKGDPGTALNFTNDVLMTCKQYSFKTNLNGPNSTTDKFGRTSRKITARCGSNQVLVAHAETLQAATPDSQIVSTLVMRDIVTNPITNTTDFTTGADGSAAIPSGVSVEFFDSAKNNALTNRLVCCVLDSNQPEGKPTIE